MPADASNTLSRRSELSRCGLSLHSYEFLSQFYEEDVVFASFYFLRTGESYFTISKYLAMKFGRGWGERTCANKIPQFFSRMYHDMKNTWLDLDDDILFHEDNNATPFWNKDVKVLFDTVPLYVDNLPHCYQP